MRKKTLKPRCEVCGYTMNMVYYHSFQTGVNGSRIREMIPIPSVWFCKRCGVIKVDQGE